MTDRTIVVARDFSPYPAGRYRKHGPFTGEVFREDFLVPALGTVDRVFVDFNGTEGVRSSFLEEAFGGLIRESHLTESDVQRIEIAPDGRSTALEVAGYINDELKKSRAASKR